MFEFTKSLSINKKMSIIFSLVVVLFVSTTIFSTLALNKTRTIALDATEKEMFEGQKQKLKVSTHSIALALGEQLKNISGRQERVKAIREGVDKVRFEKDKSGYFFVYKDTTNVALPTKKELQGDDLGDTKDKNGVYFVRELKEQAHAGGGFVEYVFPKPGEGDQPKLAYAEMIPGTDYWIGTGVYLDNIAEAKEELSSTMSASTYKWNMLRYGASAAIFLVILVVMYLITRSIVRPLKQTIETLSNSSKAMTSASNEVSSSSQSLAEGSSEQASSLEETSSSLEELSSQTKQNADNAGQAEGAVKETSSQVEGGTEAVQRMSQAMKDIQNNASETSRIIKTIDDIAFQTNLLALNAAVEAARAGEAGKGFAVVAEEVRNLAQRSADAAKETSELIEKSQTSANNGAQVAEEVSSGLDQIKQSTDRATTLVAEIYAASQEQSQGIEQVNNAVSEMDKVVQQNASNAEESASAAEELFSQAGELDQMVQTLVGIVEGAKASSAVSRTEGPPAKGDGSGRNPSRSIGSSTQGRRDASRQQTQTQTRAEGRTTSGQGSAGKSSGHKDQSQSDANRMIPLDEDDSLSDF